MTNSPRTILANAITVRIAAESALAIAELNAGRADDHLALIDARLADLAAASADRNTAAAERLAQCLRDGGKATDAAPDNPDAPAVAQATQERALAVSAQQVLATDAADAREALEGALKTVRDAVMVVLKEERDAIADALMASHAETQRIRYRLLGLQRLYSVAGSTGPFPTTQRVIAALNPQEPVVLASNAPDQLFARKWSALALQLESDAAAVIAE